MTDDMCCIVDSNILISGLGGLGAEVAKNVILAGARSVTLHDNKNCTRVDLLSQPYLKEADIGRNRADASHKQLSDLNKHVPTTTYTGWLTEQILTEFHVVVLTTSKLAEQRRISKITHQDNIALIIADTRGPFAQVFCDFGENFLVHDTTEYNPISTVTVTAITKNVEGIVTCMHESSNGLENGDYVTFNEVEGMTELNGINPIPIKVLGPHTFSIGDTTKFSEYIRGGIAKQVKMPRRVKFLSFEASYANPSFIYSDAGNFDKKFAKNAACELLSMVRTVGSIDAREVTTACSGKFMPIHQYFYLDLFECLSEQKCKPAGSRNDKKNAAFEYKFEICQTLIEEDSDNNNINTKLMDNCRPVTASHSQSRAKKRRPNPNVTSGNLHAKVRTEHDTADCTSGGDPNIHISLDESVGAGNGADISMQDTQVQSDRQGESARTSLNAATSAATNNQRKWSDYYLERVGFELNHAMRKKLKYGDNLVGRPEGNNNIDIDIGVDSLECSQKQCTITVADDESVLMTDMESTNGTAINGMVYRGETVTMRNGDVIAIVRYGYTTLQSLVGNSDCTVYRLCKYSTGTVQTFDLNDIIELSDDESEAIPNEEVAIEIGQNERAEVCDRNDTAECKSGDPSIHISLYGAGNSGDISVQEILELTNPVTAESSAQPNTNNATNVTSMEAATQDDRRPISKVNKPKTVQCGKCLREIGAKYKPKHDAQYCRGKPIDRSTECKKCGGIFSNNRSMVRHMVTHEEGRQVRQYKPRGRPVTASTGQSSSSANRKSKPTNTTDKHTQTTDRLDYRRRTH